MDSESSRRSERVDDGKALQEQEEQENTNSKDPSSSSSPGGKQDKQDSRETKQDNDNGDDESKVSNAVSLLQERYRGYRNRREALGLNLQIPQAVSSKQKDSTRSESSKDTDKGKKRPQDHDKEENKNSPLSPNTRWNDALSSGGLQRMNSEQMQNKNDARSRWQRTGFYAERITGTDGRQVKGVQEEGDGASAQAEAKAMAPNKQM